MAPHPALTARKPLSDPLTGRAVSAVGDRDAMLWGTWTPGALSSEKPAWPKCQIVRVWSLQTRTWTIPPTDRCRPHRQTPPPTLVWYLVCFSPRLLFVSQLLHGDRGIVNCFGLHKPAFWPSHQGSRIRARSKGTPTTSRHGSHKTGHAPSARAVLRVRQQA